MKSILRSLSLTTFLLTVFLAASAIAAEKEVMGMLLDINPGNHTITVGITDKGQEKRMKYKVKSDAKWHICLKDKCEETTGDNGFRVVEEYAQFEAYGLPLKSYKVSFIPTGEEVSSLHVEIVPGKHK